jgi:magnesium transporter
MSESPKSEKYMCLTRFSTPVPELDDHRFQLDSPPRIEATADISLSRQNTAQHAYPQETPQRPDLLSIQDALREAGSLSRDFEQAILDDDRSGKDVNTLGRRFSVDPTGNVRHGRTWSRTHQELANLSRESSPSARSSSPPNSVEAFADPRRRERANTLESHAAPDLEAILQRTVSGGTHPRRPTFSNASAIRPQPGDIQLEPSDETCVPTYEQPGRIPVIDYEELEEFVALSRQMKPSTTRRKQSLSSQSRGPRIFYDLRPGVRKSDVEGEKRSSSADRSSSDLMDTDFKTADKVYANVVDEKDIVEKLQNENEPTRFGFFSSESQSTVHAAELGDLVLPGDTFRDLFQLGPEGGVWWLDVLNPTEEEVAALSRAFSIHPLTTEDILTQEAREKVELFKQYYFVCFRTFYQLDKTDERFMEPVNFYMVVFRDGVLSFSFTENPHAANVRKRIGKLRDYVSLSSDWICYAMIDDIVDSFGPVIREIEIESEAIEDLVFIARVDDFESFLPRIGGLRKKVMSLMRLLGGKADVIRGFSKRCNEQYSVTPRGDIGLYLGDIQDHVVTMMSNLAHFEKMLSRSHANYLAQLNVTNLVLGNHVNKVLSKVTLIATMLVPMNLICGLFGMNVRVPGEGEDGLGWFFGIVGVIAAIIVLSGIAARYYKLV